MHDTENKKQANTNNEYKQQTKHLLLRIVACEALVESKHTELPIVFAVNSTT